jgi:hypothetical protein
MSDVMSAATPLTVAAGPPDTEGGRAGCGRGDGRCGSDVNMASVRKARLHRLPVEQMLPGPVETSELPAFCSADRLPGAHLRRLRAHLRGIDLRHSRWSHRAVAADVLGDGTRVGLAGRCHFLWRGAGRYGLRLWQRSRVNRSATVNVLIFLPSAH